MMPTSTRFAVALHALTNLAVSDGEPIRSEDIARSANTSPTVIRGLLSRLADAGITKSQLGAGGGVQLAKSADRIRLLDVYRATEDTEVFAVHRNPPSKHCPVGKNILQVLCPIFDRATAALERELASVTLADLAQDAARLGKFSIPIEW